MAGKEGTRGHMLFHTPYTVYRTIVDHFARLTPETTPWLQAWLPRNGTDPAQPLRCHLSFSEGGVASATVPQLRHFFPASILFQAEVEAKPVVARARM